MISKNDSRKILAIFDFDGTITLRDSLLDFTRYAVGERKYLFGILMLMPFFLLYAIKVIPNYILKEKFISFYFKGYSEEFFNTLAMNYSLEKIDEIVKPKALNRLVWHREQNHEVVIVSASIESWLKGWSNKNNCKIIGTQLEFEKGILTGRLSSKNCFGIEKVNRLNQNYNLSEFEYIYAYGDSAGDNEILEIANEKYYKFF